MPATRSFDPRQEIVDYLTDKPTPAARLRLHHEPSIVRKQRWGSPMPRYTSKKKQELNLTSQVGERFAAFARKKFPKHTAKKLAQETGCSHLTAKGWLQGRCPANEHLFQMWHRWGKEFAAFVLAPVDEDLAAIARYEHELQEIKQKIRELSEAFNETRG